MAFVSGLFASIGNIPAVYNSRRLKMLLPEGRLHAMDLPVHVKSIFHYHSVTPVYISEWSVVHQARDDLGHYEHLSSIPRTSAITVNDVGDIHDAAPPSFTFTSPQSRPGWSEQPADVSILSLLQLQLRVVSLVCEGV